MNTPTPQPGRVFAFFSCKGGVGTTLLTVTLGYLLAQQWQRRVLVVDWVRPYGDAALWLTSEEPRSGLQELLSQPERLDPTLLRSALLMPQSRLAVLPAAQDGSATIPTGAAEHLLALARHQFDCILCDCGRVQDTLILEVLRCADRLLPLLQPTLPMMRDARRLLATLREAGIAHDRMVPLVNRGPAAPHILQQDMLEQALGSRIRHRLPDAARLARLLHSRAQAEWPKALLHLANALARPQPRQDPMPGLLQRWWRKQWRWNPSSPDQEAP